MNPGVEDMYLDPESSSPVLKVFEKSVIKINESYMMGDMIEEEPM